MRLTADEVNGLVKEIEAISRKPKWLDSKTEAVSGAWDGLDDAVAMLRQIREIHQLQNEKVEPEKLTPVIKRLEEAVHFLE